MCANSACACVLATAVMVRKLKQQMRDCKVDVNILCMHVCPVMFGLNSSMMKHWQAEQVLHGMDAKAVASMLRQRQAFHI